LSWSKWIRQAHRWLSVAFTVAVITTTVAMAQGKQGFWVYLPLPPLGLLFLSGAYLFVLPHVAKRSSAPPGGTAS
jgi:hypothetical protein